ncbi:MAG: hypothetical protein IH905_04630 [Proteobacteria bacterium]|nr:hypothetical protein [Pseudomonadota bacterium]
MSNRTWGRKLPSRAGLPRTASHQGTCRAKNQPFSIERPVGVGETNHSDDLEAVRNALAARGLCQRTVTGQRNAKFKPDLTAGVRIFQRQAGLHPDGLVIPRGPTAMALALGGEVQVRALPPAGGPERESFCRALARDIGAAEGKVERLKAKIRSGEQELNGIGSSLGSALRGLGLNLPTGEDDLEQILRELDRLPDPFQSEVQAVRNLISELRAVAREVTDDKIELAEAERDLRDLQADFARDC